MSSDGFAGASATNLIEMLFEVEVVTYVAFIVCAFRSGSVEQSFWPILHTMGTRGVIGDKWSMRILWACAIGSAVGLYMVAVERQTQNRARMLAEELRATESGGSNGEDS
ncbi:hypothetical protein DEO72_LG2g3664 [Vigna unguiculata]|uniref:Uncharacterized protein n=1 Tax=Vigna unguiculata TaxID=3917 RepID=A0A4D6L4B2_VIGUN|nr:hypothetical protein DEO72_LG2g3663 [Vigna unguiculata]QCD83320.1 hypothetical protein DEO72_LG2g3664 [Vigna unguiculata]